MANDSRAELRCVNGIVENSAQFCSGVDQRGPRLKILDPA
jgi:hypothetical protein